MVPDDSEARPESVGSSSGTAVKALTIRPRMQTLHMVQTSIMARILACFESNSPVLRYQKVTEERVEEADELAMAVSCFAEPTMVSTNPCRRFAMRQNNQPATKATIVSDVSVVTETSQSAEHSELESAMKAPAKRLTMTTMQMAAAIAMAIG